MLQNDYYLKAFWSTEFAFLCRALGMFFLYVCRTFNNVWYQKNSDFFKVFYLFCLSYCSWWVHMSSWGEEYLHICIILFSQICTVHMIYIFLVMLCIWYLVILPLYDDQASSLSHAHNVIHVPDLLDINDHVPRPSWPTCMIFVYMHCLFLRFILCWIDNCINQWSAAVLV